MRNSRKGFTLAEVLVTLAIIGVVAALTIPTLITSTNTQKNTAGLKKTIATLNSALQMNQANYGTDASLSTIDTSAKLANWFIYGDPTATTNPPNLAFLKKGPDSATAAVTNVWLADGTRVTFMSTGACTAIANPSSFTPTATTACWALIDVNGDKGPNTISTAANLSDIYVVGISPTAVVPVTLAAASSALTADTLDTITASTVAVTGLTAHAVPSGNSASLVALTNN